MELPIELDASSNVPLHRQLYEGLRGAIVGARVAPGRACPRLARSPRRWAFRARRSSRVSRNCTARAICRRRPARGRSSAMELPEASVSARSTTMEARGKASIRLSTYGASLTEARPLEPPRRSGLIDFRDGRPAFEAFPHAQWRRALAAAARGDGSVARLQRRPGRISAVARGDRRVSRTRARHHVQRARRDDRQRFAAGDRSRRARADRTGRRRRARGTRLSRRAAHVCGARRRLARDRRSIATASASMRWSVMPGARASST